MALAGSKIYVAEYFSDTLAVVDLPVGQDGPLTARSLGARPSGTARRRGELLFNDATICRQHWQSCASCHPDGRSDGLNWDLLNDGVGNPKNTKSMLLAHRTPPAMSEGVRLTAEAAVRSGLTHILYADRPEAEAMAIDEYLKSLAPVPSPHLIDGQLSPAARRGKTLFESKRVGCQECHPAPLYTDLKSHQVGSAARRTIAMPSTPPRWSRFRAPHRICTTVATRRSASCWSRGSTARLTGAPPTGTCNKSTT